MLHCEQLQRGVFACLQAVPSVRNWADGSLLTKRHKLRTDDGATARHEHEAKRNANAHRERLIATTHRERKDNKYERQNRAMHLLRM